MWERLINFNFTHFEVIWSKVKVTVTPKYLVQASSIYKINMLDLKAFSLNVGTTLINFT